MHAFCINVHNLYNAISVYMLYNFKFKVDETYFLFDMHQILNPREGSMKQIVKEINTSWLRSYISPIERWRIYFRRWFRGLHGLSSGRMINKHSSIFGQCERIPYILAHCEEQLKALSYWTIKEQCRGASCCS